MTNRVYYALAVATCVLWAIVALAILEHSYARIDLVQQETNQYYF